MKIKSYTNDFQETALHSGHKVVLHKLCSVNAEMYSLVKETKQH
jgi:hypothetical protein